ncbi:hypothetical protein AUP74_01664 [Microbulbifer aggregans]|uniref:Acyl-CoA thioesterase 2 n=1 Tax=Microbulbifer aggregans TaxID=1769779 RepID=A0A1C9W7G2_9GAMM|nr:thioesterase family protein [Microbulbifer aggregans]AOS97095.1 hypothetical protein AUP74_01664 [Microbulbifer aggregans]
MEFDRLFPSWRTDGDLHIPEGWAQGRATFGGLVAAMLHEPMSARVSGDASLRSITFSFVAPAEPGDLEVSTAVLRAGKSVTQVEGRALQDGQPVIAALASFGSGRESSVKADMAPAPDFPSPDQCPALPDVPGLVPEFTRHFDYRIARGAMPFSGSHVRELGGWVRFRHEETSDAPAAIGHLLALIDAWPPALLPMLTQPAPASSLTWTIEFMEPLSDMPATEWWQYLAEVEQAADGYGVIGAKLWDSNGRLAAFTRQTVTVFG